VCECSDAKEKKTFAVVCRESEDSNVSRRKKRKRV